MKFRPFITLVLCGALTLSTQATSINFAQIDEPQSGRQTPATTQAPPQGQTPVNANITVESLERPEFVRLSDGRLIPYGPGVVCSDACVEADVLGTPKGFPKRWLIALPIAGAVLIGLLARDTSITTPRTNVGGVTQDPTPTPTPTPGGGGGDNPTNPVPEPGTLALFGAGLAVLARRRIQEFCQRKQK